MTKGLGGTVSFENIEGKVQPSYNLRGTFDLNLNLNSKFTDK